MSETQQFGLGCRPSPPDRRDYPAAAFLPARLDDLPEEYRLPFLGEVENQGSTSMCVDFSLVTMKEVQEHVERGVRAKFGHGYIYGRREADDYAGEGMYIREALDTLLKWGIPPASTFDVTGTVRDCTTAVANRLEELDRAAKPQRIAKYVRCWAPEQVMGALYHLRSPVAVGIIVTKAFMWLTKADGIAPDEPASHFEENSGYEMGGHAMVIVGWRRIGGRLYYVCQNSWGRFMGDGGFYYLPADYPGIYELWAVTDARPRGRYLRLPIGEPRIEYHWPQADGTERVEVVPLDVGATLLNGRTVLPVRAVADGLTALMQGLTAVPKTVIPLPNVDAHGNVLSVDLVIPEAGV